MRTGRRRAARGHRHRRLIRGVLLAPAFSHRFVVLGFAVTTSAGFLAAPVDLVYRCPRASLSFFFSDAVLDISLLDVLGLPFLLLCVFAFIPSRHLALLPYRGVQERDYNISSALCDLTSSTRTDFCTAV